MSHLTDYKEIDRGYVAFGGNPKVGNITGKGTIKTGELDFENVYFVKELKFNLYSVSQMYDKNNSVHFNDTKCVVLSPDFKLTDENHILLRVPRKNNMYSVDLKNIIPKGGEFWTTAKSKIVNEEVQIHALVDDIERIGNGFSGKETPLLPTMVGPKQVQTGKGLTQPTDTQYTSNFDMTPHKPKKTQKPRQPKRKTTKVTQYSESTNIAVDEAIHKEWVTVWYERVSKMSSDSLLAGVNTPRSDEDRLKNIELMKIYTTLQKKVLDLEDELKRTKTAQQTKIYGLQRRVKKLEKKQRSRTHKLKRLYKVGLTARVISSFEDEALDKEDTSKQERIDEIDADKDIALEEVVEVVTNVKMIIDAVVDAVQVTTAIADILVSAAETIFTTAPTITAESTKTNVKITQAPKRKGIMIREPEETTTTKTASSQQPKVQDKGKGKAKMIKEHAKVDADYQLAKRLQAEEQQELNEEEKAKLFMELLEKMRKFFAAKRTKEKRDRPPTKAQQRSLMCIYLKNIDGWKPKALKNKSFVEIQELFDKAMNRINNFIDFKTELVEESTKKAQPEITQEKSSKRARGELEQESSKKQKIDDDTDTVELKLLVNIISDEEGIAIDAIPLAVKPSSIVDWKKISKKILIEKMWKLYGDWTELVVDGSKKDEVTEGSLKRTGEELEQENAKKQKMKDDKEYAELK
uniref:Putative ribonuclease H-like domain-containing protein n=1 Tax=Tanacetum cinerariifolium TaxID=118510 RepID=A0A699GRY0_TANCI|nr:putative ribonuclease H-like domain-containing protein [Tanacetum cinerariifolium]